MAYRKFITGYVNLIMASGAVGGVASTFKNIDDNYKYYKNDKEGREEFSNGPVKTVFYAAVDAASSAAAGSTSSTCTSAATTSRPSRPTVSATRRAPSA